ncbi:MAG TPA: hypothetical protein PKI72_01260 [Giesbergeria sp.]|jgi:hypothetical protein|nr:hypothetical protein [Giesbergeria sp.]
MDSRHLPLLRLAGLVLVIAGLVDIAALAYSLSQGTNYPAGWGLFALASGALVFRGSLLAAFVVRWVACLALAASTALLLGMPMMQPFSLTFTQLRLNQGPALESVAITAAVLALLAWLVWQLGRAPIRAARHSAGLPQRSMLVPVLAGVAMVMVLAVFLVTMRIGTTANNAKILAEQKVGPGYRFHISSLRSSQGDNGKSVVGVVIAWKEDDIQRIPVHWLE